MHLFKEKRLKKKKEPILPSFAPIGKGSVVVSLDSGREREGRTARGSIYNGVWSQVVKGPSDQQDVRINPEADRETENLHWEFRCIETLPT